MLSKYLKKTLVFSAFAVGIFAFVLSCDNPFSNNLGGKVDIEPPSISVIAPVAGAYVQGVALFTGTAEAYRELDGKEPVKVRVLNPDEEQPPLLDWTTAGITLEGNSNKKKTWTYALDTLNFFADGQGLEDGILKIQFLVKDSSSSSKPVETVELVYIVKNKPSIVKLTAPDQNKLDSDDQVQRLGTNTELRGNIIDRRGIKPGYPMLKLWPQDLPEPKGDDPDWGWVSLFISGTDDPDTGEGVYANRNVLPVVRSANFVFRLSQYTIDPATRQAKYDISGGDYKPLDSGLYRFRIITSESYFYTLEEAQQDTSLTYLFPRDPKAEFGEVEPIVSYTPEINETVTNPHDSGPYYSVQLISSGVSPTVELDNADIDRAVLAQTPNVYITESTAKKIVADTARTDFRLRIITSHPDLIKGATLEWEHVGQPGGFLPWDNAFDDDKLVSLGYANPADEAGGGHLGAWKDPANQVEGKFFQFTADCSSLKDADGNFIFTSSTEPYTLVVTVSSTSDIPTTQKYTLYLDGDGPSVSIRSIRGAALNPVADGDLRDGGIINENTYTVNGNIQVSVDRTANMGIRQDANGASLVKWIVEEDKTNYLAATDTVYSKLKAFRNAPTAAGLEFFNNIEETLTSGWVQLPSQTGTHEADKTHNFKLNTKAWDGKELWLYVIAQDGIENLGFTIQKIKVDENTDIPGLSVPGLRANTETIDGIQIDSKDKLYIALDDTDPGNIVASRAKINVLDRDNSIALSLSDDDAIGKIHITLEGKDVPLNIPANSREWNGSLTQEMMAKALYENDAARNLEDGVYMLFIRVEDDVDAKVSITRAPPQDGDTPVSAGKELRFYFAVQSQLPEITIESPGENSMQTNTPVAIYGTVKSRLRIQKLDITFTPKLVAGGWNQNERISLPLYSEYSEDDGYTKEVTAANWLDDTKLKKENGVYIYYWTMPAPVNFDPPNLFDGATPNEITDARRFNIRAWDGMSMLGVSVCNVQVDTTPPEIEMVEFNFGRYPDSNNKYWVNGKVPALISATDLNGIWKNGNEPEDTVHIRWWVVEDGASVPVWNTPFPPGAGGWFTNADDKGGGNYQAVFNTTKLTDKATYKLYAMAEDNARNFTTVGGIIQAKELHTFTVDQDTDIPELREITPADDVRVGSAIATITGTAFDDDGYDPANLANYVKIRWPDQTDEEFYNTVISVSLDSASGEISFSFDFSTIPYFSGDGTKNYRITLWDEAVAAASGNPPGKNPDGVTTGPDALGVESKDYPSSDGWYSFTKKTLPPQIFFKSYDPDSSPGHSYSAERPVFNEKEKLIAALNGSWVEESSLASFVIFYNNAFEGSPTATVRREISFTDTADGKHYLNLNDEHGVYDSANWDSFFDHFVNTFITDGAQSITIRAVDTLNNMANVEWSFSKDESGPEITFVNVPTDGDVVSGDAGVVSIKGTFFDSYSPIKNGTFTYAFDANTEESGTFTASGNSATWEILIPGADYYSAAFPDGPHSITVSVEDELGNPTTKSVTFIVDRGLPVISPQGDMKAEWSGSNEKKGEEERVFSAAYAVTGAAKVFTLSGLVYEHNLSGLNAVITTSGYAGVNPNVAISLSGIKGWLVGANSDNPLGNGTGGTNNITGSNFRIKKAVANDLDSTNGYGNLKPTGSPTGEANVYVWELDISRSDLAALRAQSANDGDWRQITVTATDLAGNLSRSRGAIWRFRIDGTAPEVEFLGIEWDADPDNYNPSVFAGTNFNLSGIATDDANIKEVQYRIAKWNYATNNGDGTYGSWFYYNGTTWTETVPSDWKNILDSTYSANKTANWQLNDTVLGRSNLYPSDLFSGSTHQGKYRLDIRVTDWSLSDTDPGNPIIYDPSTATLGPVFFIDRADPTITNTGAQKSYYKVVDKDTNKTLTFTFDVTDANPVPDVDDGGVTATLAGLDPSKITVALDRENWNTTRTATVTLTMTDASNDLLDNGIYQLVLTVKDAAGNTASVGNIIDFRLDNTPPEIAMTPAANNEAITGRVTFRGRFTKTNPDSPVSRVAFYVGTTAPGVPALDNRTDAQIDADLKTNGWYFNNGGQTGNSILRNGNIDLMQIEEGTATANIIIPDTRNFIYTSSPYIGVVEVDGYDNNVTFGKKSDGTPDPLVTGDMVRKLTIHFLAIDQAGNYEIEQCDYWVYPEGDRPKLSKIRTPDVTKPEAERMMNGRIRLSGDAIDNVRVKSVWFRVYDDDTNQLFTNLRIPQWNENWGEKVISDIPQYQDADNGYPKTIDGHGSGWYLANGGGKRNLSWWAFINAEGELDPTDSESRRIRIEIMAEDTMETAAGAYDGVYDAPTAGGRSMFSKEKMPSSYYAVTAIVVAGAPRFEDELVLKDKSSTSEVNGAIDFTQWEPVASASVRGRAAYSVTVKHPTGVKKILWNRSGGSIDLLDATHTYNTTTYATDLAGMDAASPTGPGIALKAMPKNLISGSISKDSAKEKTFMIWEADTGTDLLDNLSVKDGATERQLIAIENAPYTIFTLISGSDTYNIGDAQVMEMTDEGDFEWVIVVDINTNIISYTGDELSDSGVKGPTWGDIADIYSISFTAEETSKVVAKTADETAEIPVDNRKPRIQYSHNTNVAGESPTFGGVAGDPGKVSGLSQVVLWFSRNGASIPWNDKVPGSVFVADNTAVPAGITLPTGIDMPAIPPASAASGNYSSVVIHREYHDPMGSKAHHGHKLRMGFATGSGSALDTSWYVELNSTEMVSGRITAHYIVYDKAGNATYGSQKLIIMNGIPRIKNITLATEIRKDTGLRTALGSLGTSPNADTASTYGNRSIPASPTGALATIRNNSVFTGDTTFTDAEMGISRAITIDTTKLNSNTNTYNVYDEPYFTVRNNLLAIRVETVAIAGTESSGKDRHYRVEYVSGAKEITGAAIYGAGGVKENRVYIIKDRGDGAEKFPWGSLGAQGIGPDGDIYNKGQAFLALVDGADITSNIPFDDNGYGTVTVWELNSRYEGGTVSPPTALQLNPVTYNASNTTDVHAEFVYRQTAFTSVTNDTSGSITNYNYIRDFTPNLDTVGRPVGYTSTLEQYPWEANSLFIIRAYAGDEAELFGDFALLSIRVNNNDATPPYAQLYDLNPHTEGVDNDRTQAEALASEMGANRAKGGLWNTTGNIADIDKSGHIEPRKTTSLTSSEMGGAASSPGTLTKPYVDAAAFFEVDTVSGEVIVRGYAEDDQRVGRVDLEFYNEENSGTALSTVTILQRDTAANATMMQAPTAIAARVKSTETVELTRHRVEWAYLWNSEDIPGGNNVVGNINVRAVAYNANTAIPDSGAITNLNPDHASKRITLSTLNADNRNVYDSFNPDFPVSGTYASGNSNTALYYRYNDIRVNIRPYITGFLRNQDVFSHNTRSRQGRYMFARGETPVVKGFNLTNGTGNTVISLPGAASQSTRPLASNTERNNYVVNTAHRNINYNVAPLTTRYRILGTGTNTTNTIPAGAITGNGLVTLSVNSLPAVNTGSLANTSATTNNGSERWVENITTAPARVLPRAIQPWNVEYSAGIEGSELWDDFTLVHIWKSDDPGTTRSGPDQGSFPSAATNFIPQYPAMTIDPRNGTLYVSQSEGGSSSTGANGNSGNIRVASNGAAGTTSTNISHFVDPIITSDIYYSPGGNQTTIGSDTTSTLADNENIAGTSLSAYYWSAFSIIGRASAVQYWNALGGLYVYGPGGATSSVLVMNGTITNHYLAEKTWYNASTNNTATGTVFNYNTTTRTGYNNTQWAAGNNNNTYNNYLRSRNTKFTAANNYTAAVTQGETLLVFGNRASATNTSTITAPFAGNVTIATTFQGAIPTTGNMNNDQRLANATTTIYTYASLPAGMVEGGSKQPPTTDQFLNPHIITHITGTTANNVREHIHVSYYDSDTKSIKYRYNLRGASNNGGSTTSTDGMAPPILTPMWTNLDGGIDYEDYMGGNTTETNVAVFVNETVANLATGSNTTTIAPGARIRGATNARGTNPDAGEHNAIAVTSQGYPVIAYYDTANRKLRIAISNRYAPILGINWQVFDAIPATNPNYEYTGQYVSIAIDTSNNVHIAALNSQNKQVVYIKGSITVPDTPSTRTDGSDIGYSFTSVQVVDNVGNVGKWCNISLDATGNPWIAYKDDDYNLSRDGVKMAYLDPTRFYKGSADTASDRDRDIYNTSISGWEAMHVPTQFRVQDARIGMERFPTYKMQGAARTSGDLTNGALPRFAAVGYLSLDLFRVAYYVE